MQTADAVVRLQAMDGAWETCGVDRRAGISPEGIQLSSNDWGNDTASFTLRRTPSALWPDLAAFTPVEIEIAGVTVWEGFISQTPTTDADGGSVNVQCKGWQYHLDDDSVEKTWVHSRLADWQEPKNFQTTSLTAFPFGSTVQASEGVVTVGWAKGSTIQANTYAAVLLDLGPEANAQQIAVSWVVPSGGNYSTSDNMKVVARSSDSLKTIHVDSAPTTPQSSAWPQAMGAVGTGSSAYGTFANPSRYVLLGVQFVGGTNTITSDFLVQFTAIQVFTSSPNRWAGTVTSTNGSVSATYTTTSGTLTAGMQISAIGVRAGTTALVVSGSNVTLSVPATGATSASATGLVNGVVASEVVNDVIEYAPLLDQSGTYVYPTKFAVPHLAAEGGGRSPREYITAVNSYHNYVSKVGPGRKFIFSPRPATPSTVVGNWGGSAFSDASANSGDEIYSKVVVEGTGPNGQAVRSPRYAGATADGAMMVSDITSATVANPDFEANANNWYRSPNYWLVASGFPGGFVRQNNTLLAGSYTAQWQPPPLDSSVGNTHLTGSLKAGYTFKAGTAYILSMLVQPDVDGHFPTVRFGDLANSGNYGTTWAKTTSGDQQIRQVSVAWVPKVDTVSTAVVETTITQASTSNQIKVASTAGISVGQWVVANGVPTKALVTAVNTGTSLVTLSATVSVPAGYVSNGYNAVYFGNVAIRLYDNNIVTETVTGNIYFDSVTVGVSRSTMPDRRGFTRTKRLRLDASTTDSAAAQIGDVFLAAHMATPLKGDLTVTSGGVRDYFTGASLHPSQLLLKTSELIHFSNRVDPDSGAYGRDGIIAGVSYDHSNQSAQVSIDNQRNRFEKFLSRLAVVTNSKLGR